MNERHAGSCCYCKTVYIGSMEHKECCMCGHRYAVRREADTGSSPWGTWQPYPHCGTDSGTWSPPPGVTITAWNAPKANSAVDDHIRAGRIMTFDSAEQLIEHLHGAAQSKALAERMATDPRMVALTEQGMQEFEEGHFVRYEDLKRELDA